MAEHAHVIRVAKYRPQPGADQELRQALTALAGGMRGLPGLFGAQVCRVSEEPESFALVSRWEQEQAMVATGQPGLKELVDQVAGFAQDQHIEHFIAQ
jgi:heme-degrading monooxygenase HmoA